MSDLFILKSFTGIIGDDKDDPDPLFRKPFIEHPLVLTVCFADPAFQKVSAGGFREEAFRYADHDLGGEWPGRGHLLPHHPERPGCESLTGPVKLPDQGPAAQAFGLMESLPHQYAARNHPGSWEGTGRVGYFFFASAAR